MRRLEDKEKKNKVNTNMKNVCPWKVIRGKPMLRKWEHKKNSNVNMYKDTTTGENVQI